MTSAIIVAAGKGTRMGVNIDKLFLNLAGRPVVAHTWQRLNDANCIDEIILVIRDGMQDVFMDMAKEFNFTKQFRFALGGNERQDSVWNGLAQLSPASQIVAIQDGARPLTSEKVLHETIAAARETGAAVAAQRVTDTIKESQDGRTVSGHLQRDRLWAVQTPQTFRVDVIRRALHAVRDKNLQVTDDTAACELIGQTVKLIESTSPNPKITTPVDLDFAACLLSAR
ncbi:MAG: 2-C-methyl-D-erythritol 4-phosphate cytidylyltransferase [Verrucomicrobiota bacterium]